MIKSEISTAQELFEALDRSKYDNLELNLTADIYINKIIEINTNNGVIINGNNHHIFEYSDNTYRKLGDCVNAQYDNNRYNAEVLNGNETFTTKEGDLLQLKKSNIYYANKWCYRNGKYIFWIPDDIAIDKDNVFFSFRIWFLRKMTQVKFWKNHYPYNVVLVNIEDEKEETIEAYKKWTQKVPFYLINYDDVNSENNGVLIKDNEISWNTDSEKIHKCYLDRLLLIKKGKVKIHNTKFIGGLNYSIYNGDYLHVNDCEFSNKAGGAILSTFGKLFVTNCRFQDIKNNAIYLPNLNNAKSYAYICNNIFKNIGHYGSNNYAIDSERKSHILYNEFINTNYGAIRVGIISTNNTEAVKGCENLVENNIIHHTRNWINKRKDLGFQDSGDIYVATNNGKATIRYNKILDCGGCGKNRAIFCDDGAYNMDIYGNIISRTENYFDIDSRNEELAQREIPTKAKINTVNYIAYNLFDGYIRLERNHEYSTDEEAKCNFKNNIKTLRFCSNFNLQHIKEIKQNKYTDILYDLNGYVDSEGNLLSTCDYKSILNVDSFLIKDT